MQHDGTLPVFWPGHCLRCHQPFANGEAMLMVWTKVAMTGPSHVFHYDGAVVAACHVWQWAPVCDACVSEPERDRLAEDGSTCEGCGQPMLGPSAFAGVWCSERCRQRIRRVERRQQRAAIKCTACAVYFTPARRDARFCSDPCRQWALRRRRQ